MNIIKDINLLTESLQLLEDFSFQSRNIKNREKEKQLVDERRKEKLNKEINSFYQTIFGTNDHNEIIKKLNRLYLYLGFSTPCFNRVTFNDGDKINNILEDGDPLLKVKERQYSSFNDLTLSHEYYGTFRNEDFEFNSLNNLYKQLEEIMEITNND